MSANCPIVNWGDVVKLSGRRGLVAFEYPATHERHYWRLILLEGGGKEWAPMDSLERLTTQFLGMPEKDGPTSPIESWQQIPHEFDQWLTHEMDSGCLYCGLAYGMPIHQ